MEKKPSMKECSFKTFMTGCKATRTTEYKYSRLQLNDNGGVGGRIEV